jgi:hypothetical protein
MTQTNIFDAKIPLPDAGLAAREKTLLGFDARYTKIHDQLRLLLNLGELATWRAVSSVKRNRGLMNGS